MGAHGNRRCLSSFARNQANVLMFSWLEQSAMLGTGFQAGCHADASQADCAEHSLYQTRARAFLGTSKGRVGECILARQISGTTRHVQMYHEPLCKDSDRAGRLCRSGCNRGWVVGCIGAALQVTLRFHWGGDSTDPGLLPVCGQRHSPGSIGIAL